MFDKTLDGHRGIQQAQRGETPHNPPGDGPAIILILLSSERLDNLPEAMRLITQVPGWTPTHCDARASYRHVTKMHRRYLIISSPGLTGYWLFVSPSHSVDCVPGNWEQGHL